MKAFIVLVSVWLAALLPAVAFAQGAMPAEYGPGVLETGGEAAYSGSLTAADHAVLGQLPVDDSEKWRIEIFGTDGCGPCEALKTAFEQEAVLRALKEQTHFCVHDLTRESQRRHWHNFHVTQYPTIIVSPPRNSEAWPYVQVFRQAGFDGNGRVLGGRILDAIRRFLARHGRWQPTPQPQPANPTPEPQPSTPTPWERIRPWIPGINPQNVPNFPPDNDEGDEDDDKTTAAYPAEPTITIVLDPQGLGEKLKARAVEAVATKLAGHYGAVHKIRTLRLDEAQKMGLPVQAIDTPALVGSREGRMTAFLAGSVVPLLMERANATPGADDAGGWGTGLIAALVGGGTFSGLLLVAGGIALVVWFVRRRNGPSASPTDGYEFGDLTRSLVGRLQDAVAKRDAAEQAAVQAKKEAARAAEDQAEAAKRQADAAKKTADALKAPGAS